MRSMAHPNYRYSPVSEERRQRMSDAARQRLGLPPRPITPRVRYLDDAAKAEVIQLAMDIHKEGLLLTPNAEPKPPPLVDLLKNEIERLEQQLVDNISYRRLVACRNLWAEYKKQMIDGQRVTEK